MLTLSVIPANTGLPIFSFDVEGCDCSTRRVIRSIVVHQIECALQLYFKSYVEDHRAM